MGYLGGRDTSCSAYWIHTHTHHTEVSINVLVHNFHSGHTPDFQCLGTSTKESFPQPSAFLAAALKASAYSVTMSSSSLAAML